MVFSYIPKPRSMLESSCVPCGMNGRGCYFLFFAVLAARLKFAFVGAPDAPGFLIFSPEPAAMRFLLAWMLAYKPRLLAIFLTPFFHATFTGAFTFMCHYFFLMFLEIALATLAGILGFLDISFLAVPLDFFVVFFP